MAKASKSGLVGCTHHEIDVGSAESLGEGQLLGRKVQDIVGELCLSSVVTDVITVIPKELSGVMSVQPLLDGNPTVIIMVDLI